MIGCGLIFAIGVSLLIAGFVGSMFHSIGIGVVTFIFCFLVTNYYWTKGMGDVNRATQHERDQQIIDELRKMNDKE